MNNENKFKDFGVQLKKIRLDAKKTIGDVSGAIELPSDSLKKIESGSLRPAKEVVFLLASYFKLSKYKTEQLLKMAGYSLSRSSAKNSTDPLQMLFNTLQRKTNSSEQHVLFAIADNLNEDRILYTDKNIVHVSKKSGVIIEFLQTLSSGRQSQERIIAKVGMSLDLAYQLQNALKRGLDDLQFKPGHQAPPNKNT